jgi:MFS family permease
MHPRLLLSVGNFFGAAHFFLVLCVSATYLAQYFDDTQVGFVISGAAVLSLAAFPFMPVFVRQVGARTGLASLALGQAVIATTLAVPVSAAFAALGIILLIGISPFTAYLFDLLLEAATTDESQSGTVRTLFLTMASVALVGTPLLIGFLLGTTEAYGRVFLVAAVALAPLIALLTVERFPEVASPHLSTLRATASCLAKSADLRATTLAYLVLQVFFMLAPLYIPLYLHDTLGIPWSELGWMFAVMLLPFLFVEYPAGYIADRWLGDKELLFAGFCIAGTAFALVGLMTADTPLLIIALVLFLTRVGGALIEAMTEGHFFRRVSAQDTETITLFRMMRPLGTLIGPLLGGALLLTGSYTALFMVSGALIVALGIIATLPLVDSR